jgi:hypothetical protein
VSLHRPRLIALEVVKIMQDEEGRLRMPRDTSMADIKTKLYGAKDTILKSEGYAKLPSRVESMIT